MYICMCVYIYIYIYIYIMRPEVAVVERMRPRGTDGAAGFRSVAPGASWGREQERVRRLGQPPV